MIYIPSVTKYPEDNKENADAAARKETPRSDDFKKMTEPPSKEETEKVAASQEEEEPVSLFDLSRSKPKTKKKGVGEGGPKQEGIDSSESALNRKSSEESGSPAEDEFLDFFESFFKDDSSYEASEGEQSSVLNPHLPSSPKKVKSIGEKQAEPQPETDTLVSEKPLSPGLDANVKMPEQASQPTKPEGQNSLETNLKAAQEQIISQSKDAKSAKTFNKEEAATGTESSKKEKSSARSFESQSEIPEGRLTNVNAAIQGAEMGSEKAFLADDMQSSPASTIRQIATQLVEKIQIMQKQGLTETTMTLKNPPILAGATVTLTEFDHAKGEFNIRFANLSTQAKTFLDLQLAQHPLETHMDQKGIVVHNVVTTTQPDAPIATENSGNQPEKDRNQDENQKRERNQKQREEDES